MPPPLATVVFVFTIAALFWLDREREPKTSPALWLAILWMFIGASRMASQWLGIEPLDAIDETLEGSPFDRLVLMGLLLGGLMVLVARAGRVGALLRANTLLAVFFCYCALSVLWSDFPFVAFKRLTKGIGNLTMVLVVLSDPNPGAAMKRLLARVGFLLVPLSVLLIKYYPALGRIYNRWTWEAYFTGVSTDKNGLGGVCVIVGLASLWRIIDGWRHDRSWSPLIAHGVVLGMAMWLFTKADSSTALACFLLGVLLTVMTARLVGRNPAYVHALVGAIAMLVVFGVLLPNGYTYVVEALGRNTTLTGRTEIWGDLLTMDVNQWVGTGFESFWLGPRAEYLGNKYYFHPNQAHNGYIEMYVNLGWIGVGFLVLLMAAGYRRIVEAYGRSAGISTLRLALLATVAVYNVTEATFKVMHPMWIVFLLTIAFRPAPEEDDGNEATL